MGNSTVMVQPPAKEKRVSARFEYTRMTGKELSPALAEIGMPPKAFCRIFGIRPEVMARWQAGTQDIPPWVFPVLCVLRDAPNAIAIARTAAANHIKLDRELPERGEFPYLTIPDDGGE